VRHVPMPTQVVIPQFEKIGLVDRVQ